MTIKFKQRYIGTYKLKHKYSIFYDPDEIGKISFIKKNHIFIIGYLQIFSNYQGQHYGYEIVRNILSRYKVNCIVGETLFESRGFWNKCIKKFNGQRKNITTCNNCSSSFVIPRYEISYDEMEKLLNIGYEIE